MIYSNDDTDKEIRKRNYLLTVFAFPIVTALAIAGATYFAYTNKYISAIDRNFCFIAALSIGTFFYSRNKLKWLRLPNESYYKVQDENDKHIISFGEPVIYDRVYHYSKTKKIISLVGGIAGICAGVYFSKLFQSFALLIISLATGLYGVYNGIKELKDRTPKLKLSKKGIWTNKLGFVIWNNINDVKIITEDQGEHSSMFLEIYLKNTVFEEANKPDERLLLNDVEDARFIDIDIDALRPKQ